MANPTVTISKIKLPDGTIVNLSTNQNITLPEECRYIVNVQNFSGTVSLISGQDYKLTINS